MTDASPNRPAGRQSTGNGIATDRGGPPAASANGRAPVVVMTPAAALARHVDWLDFALGAATAEERWRRERLAKATKGNLAKRTDRLAEVIAEIEELTALLTGIRDLQAPAPAAPARRRGRPPGSKNGTGKRSASAAAGSTTPPATTAKITTAKATPPKATPPAARRRRTTTPSTAG